MGIFQQFPYSNFHELNLDQIIKIMREMQDEWAATKQEWTDVQAFINNYFDTLDVSEEVLHALQRMAASGELDTIIDPVIASETAAWLAEHVTPTTPAVDNSLTIEGAAADAKATGDYIREIKHTINPMINLVPDTASMSANGVTFINRGDGSYRIAGTATADTNFTIFTDADNVPSWLTREKEYYISMTGAIDTRFMIAARPGYTTIVSTRQRIKKFTAPASGGVLIAVNLDGGKTYNEIVTPVIMETSYYSDAYEEDQAINDCLNQIINLVPQLDTQTINGVTLTALEKGRYLLAGTSTASTNITIYTDPSHTPQWLIPGETYYAALQGAVNARLIVAVRPGYTFIANTQKTLKKFTTPTSGGLLIAINLDSGVTYNEVITPVIVEKSYFPDLYLPKRDVIVSKSGYRDFSYIKDAIDYANNFEGTTIHIMEGSYDLVAEFGDSFLDGLSDSNPNYGMYLGNNVKIICSPKAHLFFDYDGTNDWVVRNFSPFNTGNNKGYEVIGMNITAHNCRYIMHDDPLWADKMNFSHNVWRDCYFEMYPSPQVASWVNHQIIGGGLGYNNLIEIDSCIFDDHYSGVDHYSSLSYHNDVSGQTDSESMIIIKDCYFADGNRIVLEGYGASTVKTKVVITGNSLKNAATDIVYDSSQADNMRIYQFNNQSR